MVKENEQKWSRLFDGYVKQKKPEGEWKNRRRSCRAPEKRKECRVTGKGAGQTDISVPEGSDATECGSV